MSTHLRAFLLAVGVCVSVVLVIALGTEEPANFHDRNGGSGLWNFLYNFQTLIAGIAAVVAAAITVFQMHAIDVASEQRFRDAEQATADRHRQLIELQTRSDSLRIHRMFWPHFGELRQIYKTIRDLKLPTKVDPYSPAGAEVWQLEQAADSVLSAISEIERIIGSKPWQDSKDLFGGQLTHHLSELNDLVLAIGLKTPGICLACSEAKRYDQTPIGQWVASDLEGKAQDLQLFKARFINRMDQVFPRLYKLADMYSSDKME